MAPKPLVVWHIFHLDGMIGMVWYVCLLVVDTLQFLLYFHWKVVKKGGAYVSLPNNFQHSQGFCQECLRGELQKEGGLGILPREKKIKSLL